MKSALAQSYRVENENELKDYEKYLVDEFEAREYLRDIKNHENMLQNTFIATVVCEHYKDQENQPIHTFAFNILQNTKYTYQSVDAIDSDTVVENEEQMEKALERIK